MAELSAREMTAKLMREGFTRDGPVADSLTAPIVDTPMVVTLDELRPYELDPRITRNPLYDDIKASIRERGLDAPPPITRRPGAAHYIIRNGGNTRLAVLRELWSETKDERFFRIACLFRPWPQRGEIIALTGHLAENELHGGLSFIERALGVEKARELYEQETGKSLSQSELARRLKADGYPVPQPHISRMQEAVQYLLPAIPNVLYGGLGRHQVEQLTGLRRACAKMWDARSAAIPTQIDFSALFQDVLSNFDGQPGDFSVQRVRDELIGHQAELLGMQYDTLAFEITDAEGRWQRLSRGPGSVPATAETTDPSPAPRPATSSPPPPGHLSHPRSTSSRPSSQDETSANMGSAARPAAEGNHRETSALLDAHIVSPAATTERLQSIRRLVADTTGEAPPDFEGNVLKAIPVQTGGLYPISDVWYIDPELDDPERLRTHIAQFAQEIASEFGMDEGIATIDDGIGFACHPDNGRPDRARTASTPHAVLALLHVLSAPHQSPDAKPPRVDASHLAGQVGHLLLGQTRSTGGQTSRLSDSGLVKLFRLLRLGRRLLDIKAGASDGDSAAFKP